MMSLWRLSGAHGCNPDLCAIQGQCQLHSGVKKHELLLHGHVGICSMWGGESGMWENRRMADNAHARKRGMAGLHA